MGFWESIRGVEFVERTMPRIATALEKIAKQLEEQNERSMGIKLLKELTEDYQSGDFERILTLSTVFAPGPQPEWGDVYPIEREEGWIVPVVMTQHMPEWLKIIMDYAIEKKCAFVLFDCDININDKLPFAKKYW